VTYYAPDFANLTAGWYRETTDPNYAVERDRLDSVWSPACDQLLEEFVSQYGAFFTAFAKQILLRAEDLTDTSLLRGARYYEYYIANRALELPALRSLWQRSYVREVADGRSWTCMRCGHNELLLQTHPALIAREGLPPGFCNSCFYADRDDPLKKYAVHGPEVLAVAKAALAKPEAKRRCEYCSHRYHLGRDFQLLTWGALVVGAYGNGPIEYLYPSLFVNVCPPCFLSLLEDCADGDESEHLRRLAAFATFLDIVPTQDYANLSLRCRDRAEMLRFLSLLRTLRTPEGYKLEFGSFFAALVKAGVLPDGSRRMRLGTVTLAKDGHLCLSLVERRIDDFLTTHRVVHSKEISYPSCDLRTDWEIMTPSGGRVFVEYFGLLGDVRYRRKAKVKRELAATHGIQLIELTPKDDWEARLVRELPGLFRHGGGV
jgi:hypothetical protein